MDSRKTEKELKTVAGEQPVDLSLDMLEKVAGGVESVGIGCICPYCPRDARTYFSTWEECRVHCREVHNIDI